MTYKDFTLNKSISIICGLLCLCLSAPIKSFALNLPIPTSIGQVDVHIGEQTVFILSDPKQDLERNDWDRGRILVTFRETKAWRNKEIRFDQIHLPITYTSSNKSIATFTNDKSFVGEFICKHPGKTRISISIDHRTSSFDLDVIQLPFSVGTKSKDLLQVLGNPDQKSKDGSSSPHTINGVTVWVPGEVWTYQKYPGLKFYVDPWGTIVYTEMSEWSSLMFFTY